MTNAPVKDVKSLMNLAAGNNSPKKTGGMDQTGSFGDVMSKTQGGLAKGQMQAVKSSKTMQIPAAEMTKNRRDLVSTRETGVKQESVREDVTVEQRQEALEEAGEEIVKEVAEELGVTEEEVARAMEELGLGAAALLEPSALTELVLLLSGEQDQMALLTDENLFGRLQNLLNMASEVKNGLLETLDLNPEEFAGLLEGMKNSYGQTQTGELPVQTQVSEIQEPVVTVEVKSGDETVKLAADESGNAIKTVEVVSSNTKEEVARENADGQEQKGGESAKQETGENFGSADSLLNGPGQTGTGTAEVSLEQNVPFFSEQTREIMDQIMDYMKIQLKPGMDQLEMQLHPESLGSVHIQLSSKGGEITAQFHVQNEAVKAALESQISTLQESFREQGIKVEAVQVTVESHGFESNLWQGQGREENASSQNNRKTPRRINLNELDVNGLTEENASDEDVLAAKMMEANGNTVDYTA